MEMNWKVVSGFFVSIVVALAIYKVAFRPPVDTRHESTTVSTISNTAVATQTEVKKQKVVDAKVVATEATSLVDRSTKKTVREYDPTTGKVQRETVVETIKVDQQETKKVETASKAETSVVENIKSTTVEATAQIVDNKVDTATKQGNGLNVKLVVTVPQPDVGVAVELVKVPDNKPLIGGIAGNVYVTGIQPSVGIALTKPIFSNVEILAGLGVDLTQTQKLTTRAVIGASLKFSF